MGLFDYLSFDDESFEHFLVETETRVIFADSLVDELIRLELVLVLDQEGFFPLLKGSGFLY